MNNSEKKITLSIAYFKNNNYLEDTIEFTNFETLDLFTAEFSNDSDLVNFIYNENKKIYRIFVSYRYKAPGKNEIVTKKLPVKYAKDNFDIDDLKTKLALYIERNPERMMNPKWGLVHIIKNNSIGFNEKNTSNEIMYYINKLFEKGYKVKRDIYFNLSELGIKVKCKEKTVKETKPKNQIEKFEMRDSYQEYLQSISSRSEGDYEYAMEQLSFYDIDKMPYVNNAGYKPLFDGARVKSISNPSVELLKKLDNISEKARKKIIEDIESIRKNNNIRKIKK